jgi:hypothetical protein
MRATVIQFHFALSVPQSVAILNIIHLAKEITVLPLRNNAANIQVLPWKLNKSSRSDISVTIIKARQLSNKDPFSAVHSH